MIVWASQSVGRADAPLRNALSLPWASIGMLSILFVPNARNHFWDTATTKNVVLPIAKPTTISCLEISASFATKLLAVTVSTKLCVYQNSHMFMRCILLPVFTALNKAWCVHHFSCSICDTKMDQKSKFYEYDEKPVCKKCYERFPSELRRRLRMAHENTLKKNVV